MPSGLTWLFIAACAGAVWVAGYGMGYRRGVKDAINSSTPKPDHRCRRGPQSDLHPERRGRLRGALAAPPRRLGSLRAARGLVPGVNGERIDKEFGRSFHYDYLRKLVGKVRNQALVELDRTKIEERMSFTRENYRMMRDELLKVVYWDPTTAPEGQRGPRMQDRVEAAKSVVMLDLAILKAEIETGMYRKPIEVLAKDVRYDPLPPETRMVVIQSWRNFGLLPEATIHEMVPEEADQGHSSF